MVDVTWSGLTPLLPDLFIAFAALVMLVTGVFRGNESVRLLCRGAVFYFFIAGVLLAGVGGGGGTATALGGFFILDPFAVFMKMLVLGGMIAVTALSVRYIQSEQMGRFEYPVLLMFATLGMMLMISANNLLSLYMALELQSLSIYVLAAFRRDDGRSSEAGLKYFILGALSSGMLLFGISLIYGYTGAIGYEPIAAALKGAAPGAGLTVGLVFVLVGIAFKVSAVPFHMWTPDVYEGAPTSVTALMAIVPKVAALSLMIRLLYGPFLSVMPQWQQIVWFLSAASMVWGGFAAIGQVNIKRLIAYSSIGNMGYALIGVAAGTHDGVGAVLVYITIYMVMTAGVFGVILAMRRKGVAVESIDSLAGLSRTNPPLAWAMAFFMFSLSGIPPLAGFFGKLVVFQAAIAAGMPVLAVIGVVASVVAAYYYIRIVKVMFFDESAGGLDHDPGFCIRAVIGFSAAGVLLFILMPNELISAGRVAAAVFFPGMTIHWQVDTHAKLPSTQDYVRDLTADGAPEGTVVQALSQSEGRGRQGRTWISPMGNLYMSVLLRPECRADKAGQVSFVTAVAVSAAMDQVMEPGHRKTLKWPNDILIDGKKAAGILIESVLGQGGTVDALIVGIGVNILTPPEEAIGLASLSGGKPVPIHPFRDTVLAELAQAYHQWKHQGFAPIRTRWLKQAHALGEPVTTAAGAGGTFRDLDANGALVLTLPDGGEKIVTAGDVFFAEGSA